MFYSSLDQLKVMLDIQLADTSEDTKLLFLIEQASSIIEEFLGRPGIMFKERTEYYAGTGTNQLTLRSRPVYTTPTIQVWVDEGANWGTNSGAFASTTSLTWGTDFSLQIDQDDGTSRCGVLVRNNSVWPRPWTRKRGYLSPYVGEDQGSVKVVYSAGYTVDNLPGAFRLACNLLIMKLRAIMPFGWQITSEGYEERSVSYNVPSEDLFSLIRPILWTYRNHRF